VVRTLLLSLLAFSSLWAITFVGVVAGRWRVGRNPRRLRGVRRITVATSRDRRLRLASDRVRRRRWKRIEALRLIAEAPTHLRVAERNALVEALADDNEDVRLGALAAVSARGDELAATLLVDALVDWSTGRARVATELERQPLEYIVPLLEKLLDDSRPDVRFWALQVIGRSRSSLPWTTISGLLQDPSPNVRAALAEGLPAVYRRPTIALRRLLADDEWFVRMHAARALGEKKVIRTAPAIAELLRDPSWWVRDAAEKALVALGRAGIREALRLLEDDDPFARDSAAEVLQESGYLDRCVTAAAAGNSDAVAVLAKVRRAAGEGLVESAVARAGRGDDEVFQEASDFERGLAVAS
jgi:HEAT repeat protein